MILHKLTHSLEHGLHKLTHSLNHGCHKYKIFLKKEASCVDFRMFAAKKEHSRAPNHPNWKIQREEMVPLLVLPMRRTSRNLDYWLRLARSQNRCKERTLDVLTIGVGARGRPGPRPRPPRRPPGPAMDFPAGLAASQEHLDGATLELCGG